MSDAKSQLPSPTHVHSSLHRMCSRGTHTHSFWMTGLRQGGSGFVETALLLTASITQRTRVMLVRSKLHQLLIAPKIHSPPPHTHTHLIALCTSGYRTQAASAAQSVTIQTWRVHRNILLVPLIIPLTAYNMPPKQMSTHKYTNKQNSIC